MQVGRCYDLRIFPNFSVFTKQKLCTSKIIRDISGHYEGKFSEWNQELLCHWQQLPCPLLLLLIIIIMIMIIMYMDDIKRFPSRIPNVLFGLQIEDSSRRPQEAVGRAWKVNMVSPKEISTEPMEMMLKLIEDDNPQWRMEEDSRCSKSHLCRGLGSNITKIGRLQMEIKIVNQKIYQSVRMEKKNNIPFVEIM